MAKVKFDFNISDFFKNSAPEFKTKSQKSEIARDVADLILTEVLEHMADGKSPVTGRKFTKLNKDYATLKSSEGGTVLAGRGSNLELDGGLTSAIRVRKQGDGMLRLTLLSGEQPKADGHNNFSGKSRLPRRPFVPDVSRGEFFSKSISKKARDLIREALEDG